MQCVNISPVCPFTPKKMEETDKKIFREIVENIFVRWTALKLAVEHGMGGKSGQQVRNFVISIRRNQTFCSIYLLIRRLSNR